MRQHYHGGRRGDSGGIGSGLFEHGRDLLYAVVPSEGVQPGYNVCTQWEHVQLGQTCGAVRGGLSQGLLRGLQNRVGDGRKHKSLPDTEILLRVTLG